MISRVAATLFENIQIILFRYDTTGCVKFHCHSILDSRNALLIDVRQGMTECDYFSPCALFKCIIFIEQNPNNGSDLLRLLVARVVNFILK